MSTYIISIYKSYNCNNIKGFWKMITFNDKYYSTESRILSTKRSFFIDNHDDMVINKILEDFKKDKYRMTAITDKSTMRLYYDQFLEIDIETINNFFLAGDSKSVSITFHKIKN